MWLIHEHSRYTSAIDKYWIFETKKEALSEFYKKIDASKEYINIDYLLECNELSCEESDLTFQELKKQYMRPDDSTCIYLIDGDYLVLTEIDKDGFGRRP